jgi:hypothetical protein
MIKLVAKGARKKLASGDLNGFAFAVDSSDGYVHGTFNDSGFSGKGKTSLDTLLLTGISDDFGVYKLEDISGLGLYNYYAAKHTNLGGGKTYAVGISHGFCHIVKKSEYTGSDSLYRSAHLTKYRIIVFSYIKFCHIFLPL